jgi:hypothetical protein
MQLQRIGIKIFAAEPVSVDLKEFIPVFHAWIQKQAIAKHLLIDVHDYSHIHHGPGILLVAHEGNFSIDMGDGRLGLLYHRKQPVDGAPETRVAAIVETAISACQSLEKDSAFSGRLRFKMDEMVVVANDRLNAPNDRSTYKELEPVLSAGLKLALGNPDLTLSSQTTDGRERLAIRVLTSAPQARR